MKRNLTMTMVLFAIIGLTLTSCSSWRYNNPRVSVDKQTVIYTKPTNDAPKELSASSDDKMVEESKTETRNTEVVTNLSSKPNKPVAIRTTHRKAPMLVKTNTEKSKPAFEVLADLFKKKADNVNKTKHVEKAAASGWVRIMIILFVVGFILLLIGIFLSVFVSGGFWWLFYAFGALCIFAGIIVLILGLLGLI